MVAVAAFGGLLFWAFRPQPVNVETATATRGPLLVTVDHEGKTRVKDRFVVSAPLAGRLQRVALKAGDSVEAGKTLIAVIEPTDPDLLNPRAFAEAEARVKAAEAAVKQTTAQCEGARSLHELARGDLKRAQNTAKKGVSSQADLDAAEHKEQAAQEDVRAAGFASQVAQFDLELAKAALVFAQPGRDGRSTVPRFEIHAPISGRVFRVFQESATVVTPGTRLMELADARDLEIEVDQISTSAVQVLPGARMIVEHWGGPEPLEARVRVVEPSAFTKVSSLGIEEQRVNIIADFVSPHEKRATLGDGFRVEARVVVWESPNVLKIPSGALFREAGEWSVFVVDGGRAKLRRVAVGHRNDLEAEVARGLTDGETVVVYPSDRVEDGRRVSSTK